MGPPQHRNIVPAIFQSEAFLLFSQILIGSVWLFHGFYSKILDGIPRHRQIVSTILGERIGPTATKVIGAGEVLLGIWVFTGIEKIPCAAIQTLAIVAMNVLEITLARNLLIHASGMVALNVGLLALAWNWALAGTPS